MAIKSKVDSIICDYSITNLLIVIVIKNKKVDAYSWHTSSCKRVCIRKDKKCRRKKCEIDLVDKLISQLWLSPGFGLFNI